MYQSSEKAASLWKHNHCLKKWCSHLATKIGKALGFAIEADNKKICAFQSILAQRMKLQSRILEEVGKISNCYHHVTKNNKKISTLSHSFTFTKQFLFMHGCHYHGSEESSFFSQNPKFILQHMEKWWTNACTCSKNSTGILNNFILLLLLSAQFFNQLFLTE